MKLTGGESQKGIMTIGEAVKEGTKILRQCSQSAWLDASVILANVIGKNKVYLTAHSEEALSDYQKDRYFSFINKRFSGEPVQYIIGYQEFMSLDFFVDKGVLIPRPDTEILVEEVLKYTSVLPQKSIIKIADIGTGSGCIAVSIAKNTANTFIKAVDISREALKIAEKNACLSGVKDRIEFICSDLFPKDMDESFDIIVSNPPYIPTGIIDNLQVEIKDHEPFIALDGGQDGLEFYRQIIEQAGVFLKPKGLLALEIGCEQARAVKEIANGYDCYINFKIINDLSGKDRVVTMLKKEY